MASDPAQGFCNNTTDVAALTAMEMHEQHAFNWTVHMLVSYGVTGVKVVTPLSPHCLLIKP